MILRSKQSQYRERNDFQNSPQLVLIPKTRGAVTEKHFPLLRAEYAILA